MTQPVKKPKMTAKERYHYLEEKQIKIEAETQALYAKIDDLRKKSGVLDAEIREAYTRYKLENKL